MYRDLLAEQKNTIIGIDLGTTNSLVAVATDCSVRVIPSPTGAHKLPSVFAISESGERVVGHEARRQRVANPERTITSIKRFMGMDGKEASKHASEIAYTLDDSSERYTRVAVGDMRLSAPEISAAYLSELKGWAEKDLGRSISDAVITVPAYFNDAQRQATRDAAVIAGLTVKRVVNEPTAAALAYGLEKNQQGRVAVFDFGGGTFDVSILELTDGVFQVLATGGDTRLGGDDIDWAIAKELFAKSPANGALGEASPETRQRFVSVAENAKVELSQRSKVTIVVEFPSGEEWEYELSRDEMEALVRPIVERTLAICMRVLSYAETDAASLDEVLLDGGSSRMPLVQRLVGELFRRVPRYDIDPDEVVALGAAVQGRILAGGLNDMLLLDVTPLSLGIESFGGAFERLIARNTTIPASATEEFTTHVDGQTNIMLHVLQGERELAKDNRSLARLELKDIPPMQAGDPRIAVTFTLDADGVLTVNAKERRSGKEATVSVEPSSGLSREEVDNLVKASFANAEADFEQRLLLDRQNDAETLLKAVNKALEQSADEIEATYKTEVEAARDALKRAVNEADPAQIKSCLEALNEITEELATIQMNAVLAQTVRGKKLGDVV